jgi:nitric oxide synthase oxygenase domain/subunit
MFPTKSQKGNCNYDRKILVYAQIQIKDVRHTHNKLKKLKKNELKWYKLMWQFFFLILLIYVSVPKFCT